MVDLGGQGMSTPKKLQTVAIVGNGIIGHGMAEVYAAAGFKVRLIGRNEASLANALKRIQASREAFRRNGLTTKAAAAATLGRIAVSTHLDAAAGAELVVEAVPEDMDLKLAIFGRLDRITAASTVLASSSGHPASDLVAQVRRRGRVVATHFWYPPQLIPLVEVCAGPETDAAIVPWVCGILRAAGKQPVVIDREVPGFIGNRIQFAALREAWSLWAAGAASAEAIDAVVRYSIGRRLGVTGPIESADLGGLETMFNFARFLQPKLDARPEPPAEIAKLVAGGHRGHASGRGVYDWRKRDGEALLAARRGELFRWLKADAKAMGKPKGKAATGEALRAKRAAKKTATKNRSKKGGRRGR
jgi:3-hydroxybutyryl-CoA dehydrogenase